MIDVPFSLEHEFQYTIEIRPNLRETPSLFVRAFSLRGFSSIKQLHADDKFIESDQTSLL